MKGTRKPGTWRVCPPNDVSKQVDTGTVYGLEQTALNYGVDNSALTLSEGSRDILEPRESMNCFLVLLCLLKGHEYLQQ